MVLVLNIFKIVSFFKKETNINISSDNNCLDLSRLQIIKKNKRARIKIVNYVNHHYHLDGNFITSSGPYEQSTLEKKMHMKIVCLKIMYLRKKSRNSLSLTL